MGALGGMVSNAIDAFNGESSGTTLQDFLSKFSSTKGRYVDTIDPLHTFDVQFEFFPTITPAELAKMNTPDKWDRALNSLKNSAISMGTNALDNATGGLFSSIMDSQAGTVEEQRSKYEHKGKHTFLEYLVQAHFLQGGEQWQNSDQANCPLKLNLGLYIQTINIPNIKQQGSGKAQSLLGEFGTAGRNVDSDGALTMGIINTKASLHERIFYPWMREVTLPFWSYETQPYTTANIIVDFTKHNDVKYIFTGCRPTQINMLQASQAADSSNIVRDVTFAYDFMFISSKLKTHDAWDEKLLGTLGTLASSAQNVMNIK